MSDELTITATIVRRKVAKGRDNLYFVCQYTEDCGWIADGRGYAHSTSAYAKLGRIVSLENKDYRK